MSPSISTNDIEVIFWSRINIYLLIKSKRLVMSVVLLPYDTNLSKILINLDLG